MVLSCCAYNCKNTAKNKSLSFHKFPLKDPNLLKKWLKNLRWKDWKPAPNSKICSIHFEKKCLIEDGKRTRLHSWAVPTIFSFPKRYLERKVKLVISNRKRTSKLTDALRLTQTFHKTIIENHLKYRGNSQVKERWEWLGLDVRGPFSPTVDQHTHIMTLTDYHSKWVEAFPLTQKLSQDVAQCLAEVISQQGYPLGILSRLPRRILMEVNRELKKCLRLNATALVIHHRQTGYMDLVTESLLNEMLDELVKKHGSMWHIHLPAATLRLCCTNHPTTKEKPFTCMCASDPPFSSAPRELPVSHHILHSLHSFIRMY
uniref:THAP domain-containing protein 1 n=1 Tax=Sinocyclocheilus rhinocerous TaxID=307959 RepID=A0A673NNT9_9TELE